MIEVGSTYAPPYIWYGTGEVLGAQAHMFGVCV